MPPTAIPNAAYRRFESFREYESLIDAMIPRTEGMIRVFDRALSASWNSKQRDVLLRDFLRRNPACRIYVVVHEATHIERDLPRLTELQRDFQHAFNIRQTPRMAHHLYDAFVIFDASHYLHRFHQSHMRAAQGLHDVDGTQQLWDRHHELWEASTPHGLSGLSGR